MDEKIGIRLREVIEDMQEVVNDKKTPDEVKANARSYIRGVKVAIDIIEEVDEENMREEFDG